MLKTRIISGVIGALLLILIVLFGTLPLRIAVTLVSLCMLFELFRAVSLHKNQLLFIPSAIYVILVSSALAMPFIGMVTFVFLAVLFVIFLIKMKTMQIAEVGLALLFSMFIGLFMGCISEVRLMDAGEYIVWLIFIGAWASDIFAFTFGMLFGKHKLIPHVSPKKTIEGAIGGVAGTALVSFLFGIYMKEITGIEPYWFLGIGALSSVCGQIGDLTASAIKRQYAIKDYGNIMPGHGGFMDRFDSILFVAPVILFILKVLL